MTRPRRIFLIIWLVALTGCGGLLAPAVPEAPHQPPEAFGLRAMAPYPSKNSPCRIIGESEATRDFLDDSALLIGCPVNSTAIADWTLAGARPLARIGDWQLLHVPQR